MSIITSTPTRAAIADRRAQVMTEAVVSAYIREITRPRRLRERADSRRTRS